MQSDLRATVLGEGRPNSVVRLAECLSSVPVITAARAERLLGVTRPTVHKAIDAMVERGDLVEMTDRQRGRVQEGTRMFEAVSWAGEVKEPETQQLPLDIDPGT